MMTKTAAPAGSLQEFQYSCPISNDDVVEAVVRWDNDSSDARDRDRSQKTLLPRRRAASQQS